MLEYSHFEYSKNILLNKMANLSYLLYYDFQIGLNWTSMAFSLLLEGIA